MNEFNQSPFSEAFTYDTRLGIYALRTDLDWSRLSEADRKRVGAKWVLICSALTDRVVELEVKMMDALEMMYTAKDEEEMHQLNNEMMDYASIACDLNILARNVFDDLAKAHF
ncbi:hypothetical protein CIG75_15690 [Tumebacillus algifaecis]|uniref:Uncharacterized protein n=1 Tax=Tumebacillus algifaecis TaxID=1214604 RepID=A0A223D3S8_9BACL|nr:hypothetical protein [Tumebacillus algifaecis]ASS76241.1 hypothetical protein CIG75_15690 [Tumebacillus algifaecis]